MSRRPLSVEISWQTPSHLFAQFADLDGSVLLESGDYHSAVSEFSFIAIYPFQSLISKNGKIYLDEKIITGNPFDVLAAELRHYSLSPHASQPPLQGGVVGFFSYDLYEHLEEIPSNQTDDMQFPDLALGFYDLIIAFDHKEKRSWVYSSGYPMQDPRARLKRAKERMQFVLSKINETSVVNPLRQTEPVRIESNFSKETYCKAVQKIKDYIFAGDIFEANLSQRFEAKLPQNTLPFNLYLTLRQLNIAPFSAYINFNDTTIVSASPERFLHLMQGRVESRPIKGTRQRGSTALEDRQLANELCQSEKDRAENIMIVDLMRNDLSRVCEDHSVKVEKLCGLESYATVHHLVSVVTGQLKKEFNAVDLLKATFPGGSITGAPKIRAMEIINEIEPTRRGPYCGSIGYIGFNGDMDTSITIRTFAIKDSRVTFQAGGAVVMDSNPLEEYEESLIKAKALFSALNHDSCH